jgi:hypothetical protein
VIASQFNDFYLALIVSQLGSKKALENGLAFALSACGLVCVLCSLRTGEWRALSRVMVPKELRTAVCCAQEWWGGRFEWWLQ